MPSAHRLHADDPSGGIFSRVRGPFGVWRTKKIVRAQAVGNGPDSDSEVQSFHRACPAPVNEPGGQ